ncbi:MAG: formate dehydrogenase subunit alpha, partial [Candidatus Porifericomitaceae bacterium WSBS_2022_MAG_OTU9]
MSAKLKPQTVPFSCDGENIEALPDETILQALHRNGMDSIPYLCYKPGYRPDGNCRACMVEIEGERVLAPSCCRQPVPGMKVQSGNERSRKAQRMILELLLSDMPNQGRSQHRDDSELDLWVQKMQLGKPRFEPSRHNPAADLSHPAMTVNLDECIQCTRCVRACREQQVNDVIGYAWRGGKSKIVFDFDDPMGDSSCVACGECVQACPTGALMPANDAALKQSERKVNSVCPYCGVGCLLTYNISGNQIAHVEGSDLGPANKGRLCIKGRYGFDYVSNDNRLTKPLIRREGAAKGSALVESENMMDVFREASWEEALDFAGNGLRKIIERDGNHALAGFGSAKGSNEEAYLFQKLVRTGFGNNNVDHCTRLCHASSVAALLECIGSGAVSNPVEDVAQAEVIIIIGARPTVNHPVAATFIKNAIQNGTKLILMDPYRSDLARHADHFLQFAGDTDVPLLNAIMHVIINEELYDKEFVERRTEGFAALRANVSNYSPESVAPICRVPATTIREIARIYANAKAAMIFWGMGVSQHIHGTDNARCLISLALLTGNIGRPGTGLHPLRGQNNVQGASDVGLIPMMYPDYQLVGDPQVRQKFEQAWNCKLDPEPGLTVVEIMHKATAGTIRGMYIMGENPAMSDPNLNHARAALANLEHLVLQEIFFTETASYADVILPASAFAEKNGTFTNTDRRVQMGRKAIDPPGDAKQDLWIIQQIATRLGLDWGELTPAAVFNEFSSLMPSIAGMDWDLLQRDDSKIYPLSKPGEQGQPILFMDSFPLPGGKARFVPASYIHADELPDEEYPMVFSTGRLLEHWHTGSMTRRSEILDKVEPEPHINMHQDDMDKLKIQPGQGVRVTSRRGSVEA